MSQAATSRQRAGAPVGRSAGATILTYLIAALVIVPVVGIIGLVALMSFGSRSGEEISADTFSRRSYTFVEEPFSGTQLFPIGRETETGTLEQHLQSRKLLKHAGKPVARWDLYRAMPQPENPNYLDAQILVAYLEARDAQGSLVWLDWSVAHPHLAEVFWPRVGELVRAKLYVMLPELFQIANANSPEPPAPKEKPSPDELELTGDVLEIDFGPDDEDDGTDDEDEPEGEKAAPTANDVGKVKDEKKRKQEAATLRKAIDKHLVDAYTQLAGYRLENGEHDAAVRYASAALKINGQSIKALNKRIEAYEALGESEKAASDRKTVAKLEEATKP